MKHLRSLLTIALVFTFCFSIVSCKNNQMNEFYVNKNKSAVDLLGRSEYKAMSYGGYRTLSRDDQPSLSQIKEDLKILSAIGVKIIRTYNLQLDQASNILKAIKTLKEEGDNFEMYVMLGLWIECKNARLSPNHDQEDLEVNSAEIERAINYANQYPEIVKIIAVGNEAMVHWQTDYFVGPSVILKWVNHLQKLKTQDKLPPDLWITSSDNFASWGGGDPSYHNEDLISLIKAVDYISLHTYPFHDTHYNSSFWVESQRNSEHLDSKTRIELSVQSAVDYAVSQYIAVENYVKSLGVKVPIHIGETGWATVSENLYGPLGTKAADEYKQALYYQKMSDWTSANRVSCFYFEAFDEPWKDAPRPLGSENHFGLFDVEGTVKYALWDAYDSGVFKGMSRDGIPLKKSFDGIFNEMFNTVKLPN
ncbi:MAG: glycosyl hydrolase family 17 [Formosa sp.]|jgi:exo-beta-1,3-glucanase (GH17 family)|nr:glycosyl hydrolase family 17 [Formosa sp.]MDB2426664.1 glycosyl hydrolase family 17 protein [Flavobacteriaceae bacterium]